MKERGKARFICRWDESSSEMPRGPVLVEVPGDWAAEMVSLIRFSEEFRNNGLMVTNIGPGSQGARAGMARGDVLLRCDGVELDSADILRDLVKRHTQGAALTKRVVIEAARGAEDVTFEVSGGRLGITVIPSLYRTSIYHSRRRNRKAEIDEPVTFTPDNAKEGPQLIETPGELARKVVFLANALEAHGTPRRRAMGLVSAARACY